MRKDCGEQSRIRRSIPPLDKKVKNHEDGYPASLSRSHWEYFVEFASFSLPFDRVEMIIISRKIEGESTPSRKTQVRSLGYCPASLRELYRSRCGSQRRCLAPPMQVSQEISLYPVSLRLCFPLYYGRYCHLSRSNGKCACASSCNSETVPSAGRFSDRGITAEIALSSSRNERRR